MIKWFIRHQIKESFRSSIWQKSLALNILIGFLLVIISGYLLLLGIFIDDILKEIYPNQDLVLKFNGLLLYYFLFDLLMRYLIQGLPKLGIEAY